MTDRNGPTIEQLYKDAFSHLEKAKAFEGKDNVSAVKEYKLGVSFLEKTSQLERDTGKKNTVMSNIEYFKAKVIELSKSADSSGQHADILFMTALDLDEGRSKIPSIEREQHIKKCIDAYQIAAEEYLKLKDKSKAPRISQLLDRIQELRLENDPKSTFTDTALVANLPSAPTMPIIRTTANSAKAGGSSGIGSGVNNLPSAPSSSSKPASNSDGSRTNWITAAAKRGPDEVDDGTGLTEREIAVLRDSSTVNGRTFLPWLPGEEENEKFRFDHPYCDPDGLPAMSPSQIKAGAVWKRPSEFVPEGSKPAMIVSVDPLNIRQHLVSDCSFVCSLCITAAYEMKFKKKLITSIIYPQNAYGLPVYNAYGKYLVKLYINGVPRKVVVDDRLPFNPASGHLACSYSKNLNELWVSIIEKAYMKVNGGYDFPGSNSDVDLYALTGWIPEHVYFQEPGDKEQDFAQSSDRAWQRIVSAHKYGDCLITIGTGQLTSVEETQTGLVPTHAYAVLDVKEAGLLRMLKVKNPWSDRPWIGPFSSADRQRWTMGLKKALQVTDADFDNMDQSGVFWIELRDCLKYFPGYYLNWNPSLFSFRTCMHDQWALSQGPRNDTYFIGDNPQFCLIADCLSTHVHDTTSTTTAGSVLSQSIWILFTRHRKSTKQKVSAAVEKDGQDFMAAHVYRINVPRRLYGSAKKTIQGVYTDGVHTLIRIQPDTETLLDDDDDLADGGGTATDSLFKLMTADMSPTHRAFTIAMSQRNRASDINYTVNVYSTIPFKFYPAPASPPHRVDVNGGWSSLTSGAPVHNTFFNTPQYRLVIPQTAANSHSTNSSSGAMHIHLQCLYPKEVNAKIYVIPGSGSRVDDVDKDHCAITSGKYRSGYCCCQGLLSPGVYTVLLSTYEQNITSKFVLTARGSTDTFQLAELPSEGELGFSTVTHGFWRMSDGTAAGCSNYHNFHMNPIILFPITSTTPVAMTARLQWTGKSGQAINMSLFQVNSDSINMNEPTERLRNSLSSIVNGTAHTTATSAYSNKPSGVAMSVKLSAGIWAVVPSTFEPMEGSYSFTISFSSTQEISFRKIP